MVRVRRPILATICLAMSLACLQAVPAAQAPASNPARQDFSAEPYVIEQFVTKVVFASDGTHEEETSARIRVQSQAGVQQYGLLRVVYASSISDVEVGYVRVAKPGGKVVLTPAENVLDMPAEITREAPFYSDLKEKQIAVRGLEIGDVLEYQVRIGVRKPTIPGQFWYSYNFFNDEIALQEELIIRVPRGRLTKIKSPRFEATSKEESEFKVYTWKTANLKRKTEEEEKKAQNSPASHFPDIQLTSFQSWDEIAQWYRSLEEPRMVPTPDVRAKAEELTRGLTQEGEKIQAIYGFVALKFRYIGIAFGVGRYQPHSAAEVLSNGYGDCKDKHILLASLLAAIGVKAYPALLHDSQKMDPDLPSPEQFDHMITVVQQGKETLWLDTTTEVAPFGFLTANLRDKDALVIPDSRSGQLVKTPVNPPFASSFDFKINGTVSEAGTFEGKAEASIRGDLEVLLRAAFRKTPQPNWKDLVQTLSYNWAFGGTVGDVTVSSPEAVEEPFHLSYSYTRKDYSDWGNKRITPPLPPLSLADLGENASNSQEPIPLGAPGEFRLEATVELPEGYLARTPGAVAIKKDFAEYHTEYSYYGKTLHAYRRLTWHFSELPAARREDYQAFRKAINDDENHFIAVLGKDSVLSPGLLGTVGDSDTAGFIQEAQDALRRSDPQTAVSILKRAVQADPDSAAAYMMLGFLLMSMNRGEEALEAWRGLQKADPNNGNAASNMGSLLLSMKRYKEAIPPLEMAVQKYPSSAHIVFQLGQVYARTGNQEKAMESFRKAWGLDDSTQMLNAIAYELAEDNFGLDNALRYAEQAVKEVEDKTAEMSLADLDMQDLGRMNLLAADWDTLGWVHFRLGHLDEAERYLDAAWNLSQDPVVGDHLGQVYEKRGRRQEAERLYAMALAAGRAPSDTRGRLVRLLGSEQRAGSAINSMSSELGHQRTVRIPRPTNGKLTAEFFVLFAQGGRAESVKFINGAEELREAIKAIESAKYNVAFPNDHAVKLVRRGLLVCDATSPTCDFVLIPPGSVLALD